jgi:hypothetical protein
MLKAIFVGMFVYFTHLLGVQYGIIPDSFIVGLLYAVSVAAIVIFLDKG